ncbi:hypothetical protein [Actinopolymorpha pittospori]|uniref:GH16 domain-containing protein n=1 Tax=Actinopolymorpha pittospori TaxID=648752 RepID=A0A927RL76_9ACTN|nr:hypothetical protein [Actinopolymorpha pittospori]MBE1607503.1 hypothetical protein [Actinopolymorpha pittospori]
MVVRHHRRWTRPVLAVAASLFVGLALATPGAAQAAPRPTAPSQCTPGHDDAKDPSRQTVGGGTLSRRAHGPAPTEGVGGDDFVLVKNWDFGRHGTIKSMSDLSQNFNYHDQFGTIGNGTNYGALIVSPDAANALPGQPVEDPDHPVRDVCSDSMKTYLVPLDGATTVSPEEHNAGNGSFQAKWKLPNGGSLLNQDILWETRVRYVTPPYFWFALWNSGNQWNRGAEMDLIESFGFDNGGGFTNYDGRLWHSDGFGTNDVDYSSWPEAMASRGITSYDATEYHTWQWLYRKDNTFSAYVDGIEVQSGTMHWTLGSVEGGTPVDMNFIFDAGWGHTQVASVNHPLPASAFDGKFFEWDYSRVYLRP